MTLGAPDARGIRKPTVKRSAGATPAHRPPTPPSSAPPHLQHTLAAPSLFVLCLDLRRSICSARARATSSRLGIDPAQALRRLADDAWPSSKVIASLDMNMTMHNRLFRRELAPQPGAAKIRHFYGDRTWINRLDIVHQLDGHTGCVNALS